jgi:hypothetical protein
VVGLRCRGWTAASAAMVAWRVSFLLEVIGRAAGGWRQLVTPESGGLSFDAYCCISLLGTYCSFQYAWMNFIMASVRFDNVHLCPTQPMLENNCIPVIWSGRYEVSYQGRIKKSFSLHIRPTTVSSPATSPNLSPHK